VTTTAMHATMQHVVIKVSNLESQVSLSAGLVITLLAGSVLACCSMCPNGEVRPSTKIAAQRLFNLIRTAVNRHTAKYRVKLSESISLLVRNVDLL
jgi:hypothetical protein